MSTKVELLRRTPFGNAGDVVEVDDETLGAYGTDVMVKTKKPLTSELPTEEEVGEKGEFNTDRVKELDKREEALKDKEAELDKKTTELSDREKAVETKEADLTAREKTLSDKEAKLGKSNTEEVKTGAVTDAKNTAVKTPNSK